MGVGQALRRQYPGLGRGSLPGAPPTDRTAARGSSEGPGTLLLLHKNKGPRALSAWAQGTQAGEPRWGGSQTMSQRPPCLSPQALLVPSRLLGESHPQGLPGSGGFTGRDETCGLLRPPRDRLPAHAAPQSLSRCPQTLGAHSPLCYLKVPCPSPHTRATSCPSGVSGRAT